MKFQRLTIHNIASIEDAVIDFEAQPLADSEVFLITGKTGAGKSTILDSICLALFADTPRLNGTKMQGDTKDGDRTMKVDDTRQLMRRNTSEAFVSLTFIGSNNVHYEATWSVARARRKISGNIQSKDWVLKNLDTDQTLNRDKEIQAEIYRAIGLDFNQFCRTTMLAQGEFTRFLNSNNDEKAEILEKITGIDVYSKIGAKIFAVTGQKEQSWKNAQRLVEGTHILNDQELEERQKALLTLDDQYKEIKTVGDKHIASRDWIKRNNELAKDKNDAADALRIAKGAVECEDFRQKEQTVRDWNATIDARLWMTEAKRASGTISQQTALLTRHKEELSRLTGNINLDELETRIKQKETEVADFGLPKLREEFTETKVKQVKIATVKNLLATLAQEQQHRELKRDSLNQQKLALESKNKQSEEMKAPLAQAKELMDQYKTTLENQKDTVNKFAKTLRLKLHKGDICPVCRQEIMHELPHEEELQAIIRPMEEAFILAEKKYNELNAAKLKLDAEIQAESAAYIQDSQAYENDKTWVELQRQIQVECAALGLDSIDETTADTLAVIEQNTSKTCSGLESAIKRGEAIENEAKQLRKELDSKRAAIAELSEKITEANTKLQTAKENQAASQTKLNEFLTAHAELDMDRLDALNAYTSNDIAREDDSLKKAREAVVAKETLFDKATNLMEEHLAKKPELAEGDTLDVLTERIASIERQLAEIGEKKGAINQELRSDNENRTRRGTLIDDADKKKADYQKWSRMNQLIGDATGKKFRTIAQSYVLTNLIHSANGYLKMLTDRYTLKVTPGTFVITLEDAYQGFISRAASTISGGESFLVSLSLALALSDIGQTLSVDTLFIDEGFGTLSGEPLQNAINTLRSLHTKAGRHVGIISHVEELQERIPVQIQVNQESHNSSSKVKIVP